MQHFLLWALSFRLFVGLIITFHLIILSIHSSRSTCWHSSPPSLYLCRLSSRQLLYSMLLAGTSILSHVLVLIMITLLRFVTSEKEVEGKPGRQVVTFLLVCNLAMWMMNTLETNRADSHPIQAEFFGGHFAWPIITHISMPLAIFYR